MNDSNHLRTSCFDLPMNVLHTPHLARGSIALPFFSRSVHGEEAKHRTQGPRPVDTVTLLLATNGRIVGNSQLLNDDPENETQPSNTGHVHGGVKRKDRVAYRSRSSRFTSFNASSSSSSSSFSPLPSYLNSLNGTERMPGTTGIKALDQLATTRQKKLRFDRSLIHAWGLFADQHISMNDFVIEYKGELVTTRECERRSKMYEEEGRDDYIFRVDREWFVDATMKGSMARFINHCCAPNCYTQIIKHKNQSKIIIYAKRDIQPGEELSYDYKFPYEDDKIMCTCGASNCRGTMN
jgi:hypothetical protein